MLFPVYPGLRGRRAASDGRAHPAAHGHQIRAGPRDSYRHPHHTAGRLDCFLSIAAIRSPSLSPRSAIEIAVVASLFCCCVRDSRGICLPRWTENSFGKPTTRSSCWRSFRIVSANTTRVDRCWRWSRRAWQRHCISTKLPSCCAVAMHFSFKTPLGSHSAVLPETMRCSCR